MRAPRLLLLPLLAVLVALQSASAVTVNLAPNKDTTIFSEETPLSNGQGPYLYVGRTDDEVRRTLLSFDVSGIPAGATITSVSLTLNLSRTAAEGPFSVTVSLHQVLEPWGEGSSNAGTPGGTGAPAKLGDATWDASFYNPSGGSSTWSTLGGTFDQTASASRSITQIAANSSEPRTWGGAGLVGDVQEWVNNPGSNFGWIMIGNEITPTSARRFDSGETINLIEGPTIAPKLTVNYTIPEPSSVLLVLGSTALVVLRRMRGKSAHERI